MIDKNEIIEKITEDAILNILSQNGIEPFTIKDNEIWFETFCHGGDSHKLCYFRNTKTFYCYTNCGSLSLFNIVMILNNCDFKDSIRYLAGFAGIDCRRGFNKKQVKPKDNEIYLSLRKRKSQSPETLKLPTYSSAVLDYFEPDMFYEGWIKEGISPQTMHDFDIRWYELKQSIIIPHTDSFGSLVGIRRRTLNDDELAAKRKYMPLILEGVQYSHPLGLNLYGLYQNKAAIQRQKKIFIFEAEKSVMLSHTFYGNNDCSVAVCGFNISAYQMKEILKLGVEEVVLCFDKDFDENDYADMSDTSPEYLKYKHYVKKILSMAYKFVPYCKTYVIWDTEHLLDIKDSPVDKGKEVFEQLYKTKIEINTDNRLEVN